MRTTRSMGNRGTVITRLISVAKPYRSQISLAIVTAFLGLAIVMNISMASETTTEKAQAQVAYLKKIPSETSSSVH